MTDDEKRYEELKSILQPPKPELDEKDIQIAHARHSYDSLIWDYLHDMMIYIKYLKDPNDPAVKGYTDTPEKVKRFKGYAESSTEYIWNRIHDYEIPDEVEDWERLDPNFKPNILDSLEDMHGGDCTAMACTCMRCYAEGVFKLPYTATWSKHEGYKLFQEYHALKNKLGK